MTNRLYYTDAARRAFDATVVATEVADGRTLVVLDETAFYPTSGGQPFDTGDINGLPVVDVIDREDGSIAHVVNAPASAFAAGARVSARIDWPRRFDHMQQHTGQHVLSAAFDALFGVRTVSFHMSADVATIDLAREVTSAEMAAAEDEANRVVWDDRPIGVRFASEDEVAKLPLRKESARMGTLRLVEVPDCDLSACGGTHVPRTGVIGIIAISAWERFRSGSRITFVCGGRALASHRRLRDTVLAALRPLSVGAPELAAAIERIQHENKTHQRAIRSLQEQLAGHLAQTLRASASDIGGVRAVLHAQPGWDATAIKGLATALTSEPGTVAIIVGEGVEGSPTPVVASRSAGVTFDCGAWMKSVTTALGGRGGGKPELAQGGVAAAAEAILEHARASLASS
jgi:alanyl-tRNA synthetase